MHNLRKLDLSDNKIRTITSDQLPSNLEELTVALLPKLTSIDMRDLRNLKKVIYDLPHVKVIRIQRANLEKFVHHEDYAPRPMTELEELDLSNNPQLNALSLNRCPQLKRLNLSGTSIPLTTQIYYYLYADRNKFAHDLKEFNICGLLTNKLSVISLVGSFSWKIEIPMPSPLQQRVLLRFYLEKLPEQQRVNFQTDQQRNVLEQLMDENFSPADIAELVKEANLNALTKPTITLEDFQAAAAEIANNRRIARTSYLDEEE